MALASSMLLPGLARAQEPEREPWLRPTLVYETGPAYVLQNDGEYGEGGTRYGADDVAQQDNLVRTSRTSAELAIGRHTAILLYAPFELRTQVKLERDLQFRDELFAAGTIIDHRYLFEGYRASYLYRVLDGERLALELGGSVQIRNAEVAFTSADGAQRADEDDIGVVAAAKVRLRYRPAPERLWAALEADGLSTFGLVSGTKGGIYDVQLTLGAPLGRGVELPRRAHPRRRRRCRVAADLQLGQLPLVHRWRAGRAGRSDRRPPGAMNADGCR